MVEMVAASEAAAEAGSAAAEAGEAAVEAEGAGEAGLVEGVEGREAQHALEGWGHEGLNGAALAGEDLWQIGQIEGWSLDGLGQSANEVLGAESSETEPLIGSDGEVKEWVRPEEKAHYDTIGLEAQKVGGRECLVRDDIDWMQVDSENQTNLDRAEQGLAPLDRDGYSYELHHVQQREDGVLAELTQDEHRGQDIDGVLHDKGGASEIDRKAFAEVRAQHWMERAAEARQEMGL